MESTRVALHADDARGAREEDRHGDEGVRLPRSVTGVTGVQTNVATRVEQLVEELRSVTDKPIAVGFGVSESKHAKQIVDWAPTASSSVRRRARARRGGDPGEGSRRAQGQGGGPSRRCRALVTRRT